MKLGLGLYRDSLTKENFQFARQTGVTHLVVHLVDYFRGKHPHLTSGRPGTGWGIASGKPWTYNELRDIKAMINAHGLEWEAIENFDPAHWHDVLLDGPQKKQQLENLKQIIRNIGKAGIPIMGYNFSIAGVWGWTHKPLARGNAMTMVFDTREIDTQIPIPNGMVWNMIYDSDAPPGTVPQVTNEELWQRLEEFLRTLLPIAEECGVRLALHPDDPPVEFLRGAARLVNHPHKYQKLIELAPSPSNGVELCMGSVQEMADGDIYATLDSLSRQNKICYVHFRNVKGKVPYYYEVFVDEGDIEMIRALRILQRNGYDGVLVPDHTPEMSTDAPWHTGMAYALGYMRGALQALERL